MTAPGEASGIVWQFWIDRGGTFTDIIARAPDGSLSTHKRLSQSPDRHRDAATAGIKTVLGLPLDARIPPGTVTDRWRLTASGTPSSSRSGASFFRWSGLAATPLA